MHNTISDVALTNIRPEALINAKPGKEGDGGGKEDCRAYGGFDSTELPVTGALGRFNRLF